MADYLTDWIEMPDGSIWRDIEPEIFLILGNLPIMEYLPLGAPAKNHKHEWDEEFRQEETLTLDGDIPAHTASQASITIPIVSSNLPKVGDRLKLKRLDTLYEITVTGSLPTTSLTCKEVAGVALGSDTGDTEKLHITRGVKEGSQYGDFEGLTLPGREDNFTQIFRRDVQVTESLETSSQAGSLINIGSAFNRAGVQHQQNIAWEFYNALTYGIKKERPGKGQTGFLGGTLSYINVSGGNVVEASGAVTLDLLNDAASLIYDDMGSTGQLIMVMTPAMSKAVSNLDNNKIVINDPADRRAIGDNVAQFIPDISGTGPIKIVLDSNAPPNKIQFLDVTRIQVKGLMNRTFKFKVAQRPGEDALSAYILGEYTLAIKNAKQAHAVINELTIP